MSFFRLDNLRAVTSGLWFQRAPGVIEVDGIGTDTRCSLAGRAFLALRGERHDGHDHLLAAVEAGARLLIVDAEDIGISLPRETAVLRVENTRAALLRMAAAYRRSLERTRIIAVTGSCGKTTTKGMIDAVLRTKWRGTTAPKSFNNDIGVPLTILSARPSDQFLLLEVGTNAPGEIGALSAICEPDIAVITCIGRAHLEGLGDLDAIAREKASMLLHLTEQGVAIVPADVAELGPYLRGVANVITFGSSDDADLRLTDRGASGEGWWFETNARARFPLAVAGRHNALNAIAAVAVGRRLGVSEEHIATALGSYQPAEMRQSWETIGGLRLCNDAYNANPDSMIASLEAFAEESVTAGHRVIVLGDMLELGTETESLHREIGRHIIDLDSRVRIARVVLVGSHVQWMIAELARVWPADRIHHEPELNDAACDRIARMLQPTDAALLKGSRGIGLERIAKTLRSIGRVQSVDADPGFGVTDAPIQTAPAVPRHPVPTTRQ